MQDLLPQNIQGPWEEIKKSSSTSLFYDDMFFDGAYCWFNCQRFDPGKIPLGRFGKFVFSFHTEFLEHQILIDFFSAHPDKDFLLISDWNYYDSIFPSNVTTVTWITLHAQADCIIKAHGYAEQKSPSRRFSSLSYRHEFHKAAITAYLLSHIDESDRILSWWDMKFRQPYYLTSDYYIDPEIAKYILDPSFLSRPPIMLDQFSNNPLANTQWRHPAYLDCVFNLSNESIFNSEFPIGRLPGPYITDKTWKVLLSGTGLLPVGQSGTIEHLKQLGLVFDYQIDLSFDASIRDYERIIGIFRTIDVISGRSIDSLHKDVKESNNYNINQIVSKKFQQACRDKNDQQRFKIEQWIKN